MVKSRHAKYSNIYQIFEISRTEMNLNSNKLNWFGFSSDFSLNATEHPQIWIGKLVRFMIGIRWRIVCVCISPAKLIIVGTCAVRQSKLECVLDMKGKTDVDVNSTIWSKLVFGWSVSYKRWKCSPSNDVWWIYVVILKREIPIQHFNSPRPLIQTHF